MDDRLKQVRSDTNAELEPYGLMMVDPNLGWPVWHLYYFDPQTKSCFPVLRRRQEGQAPLERMSDLVQGFDPETPAPAILQWASANGVLDD